MSRYKITKTVQIAAPIEEVFKVVSDPENLLRLELIPEESPIRILSIERITKEPTGIGSVWHFRGTIDKAPIEYDEQVVEWEPPRKLVTKQISGPFKGISRWEHRLLPIRAGTREVDTIDYEPPASLRKPADRKEFRKRLDASFEIAMGKLKGFLEHKAEEGGKSRG